MSLLTGTGFTPSSLKEEETLDTKIEEFNGLLEKQEKLKNAIEETVMGYISDLSTSIETYLQTRDKLDVYAEVFRETLSRWIVFADHTRKVGLYYLNINGWKKNGFTKAFQFSRSDIEELHKGLKDMGEDIVAEIYNSPEMAKNYKNQLANACEEWRLRATQGIPGEKPRVEARIKKYEGILKELTEE